MGHVQTTIRKIITWAQVRSGTRSGIFHCRRDWQLLTPETTFGLLVDKVDGMTFWKQISQAFLPLSLSLFSNLFFLALFLRAALHYRNAWNTLCKFSMDATGFCVGRRTITFPSHFCYHISVLPCFRYVSGDVFFFLTHVQDILGYPGELTTALLWLEIHNKCALGAMATMDDYGCSQVMWDSHITIVTFES